MFRLNGHSFIILRHARDDHRHLPGTLKSQNIRLLQHESQLFIKVFLTLDILWCAEWTEEVWTHIANCCQFLPHRLALFDKRLFLWVFTSIVDCELCTQDIGPETKESHQMYVTKSPVRRDTKRSFLQEI